MRARRRVARRYVFPELLVVRKVGHFPFRPRDKLRVIFGIFGLISAQSLVPFRFRFRAALADFRRIRFRFLGNGERRQSPAHGGFHFFYAILAERCAVAGRTVRFGRAVTDDGIHDNQRRTFFIALGKRDRGAESIGIVAVASIDDLPALRGETRTDVLVEYAVYSAFYRYVVLIVNYDKFIQSPCAGKRARLVAQPFHHTAVAAERIGIMIDELYVALVEFCRKHFFCKRETDGIAHALTERTRTRFNAGSQTVLGMRGKFAPELTERREIFFSYVISAEMQDAVKHGGSVSRRKHESVAVEERRIFGIVFKMFAVKRAYNGRGSERSPGMSALGFLDGIRGKYPDGIDYCFKCFLVHSFSSLSAKVLCFYYTIKTLVFQVICLLI